MLLNNILYKLDELIDQLDAVKAVGVEQLRERGVNASVDESVIGLFNKILFARNSSLDRFAFSGIGLRGIVVDDFAHDAQSTYSLRLGEEETVIDEQILCQTLEAAPSITVDLFCITDEAIIRILTQEMQL